MTKAKKEARQNRWIREGSKVIATAGNDKGRTGTVISRDAKRAVVQGLNVRKKAVRRSEANPQGGHIDMEAPIHVSNLMLVNEDEKPIRVKVRGGQDGERELFYKDGEKEVLFRSVKKAK